MLNFYSGLSRRGFLQGAIGIGALILPRSNSNPLASAGQSKTLRRRAKSVIVLLLEGGMSHLESWDPKPQAPENIRGEFNNIATRNPELRIGQYMPKLAEQAHLYNVVRSVHSEARNHSPGLHWVLTGWDNPAAGINGQKSNKPPAMGAIVSRQLAENHTDALPGFVSIPNRTQLGGRVAFTGATYLGSSHEAFNAGVIPTSSKGKFSIPAGLVLPSDVSISRLQDRNTLLKTFDQINRQAERSAILEATSEYQQQAFDLLVGQRGRTAFDINRESLKTREMYGNSEMGQGTLLARRLVEAGANYVLVNYSKNNSWDHHTKIFSKLKTMQPQMDQAASALLVDLHLRGMLDDTLVVLMGEMGRTPTMSNRAGRDHWPDAYSVMMAGGGLTQGQVLGSTDRLGAYPDHRPVHLTEILATMYYQLGIDPDTILHDLQGRPHRILPEAKPVRELIAS